MVEIEGIVAIEVIVEEMFKSKKRDIENRDKIREKKNS